MGLLTDIADSRVRVGARTRVEPTWAFDVPRIERACAFLRIEHAVVLELAEYPRGRKLGLHEWDPRTNTHYIRVRRLSNASEASFTVWHELEHARQCEHEPWFHVRSARERRGGYESTCERQARAREAMHDRDLWSGAELAVAGPLTRAT